MQTYRQVEAKTVVLAYIVLHILDHIYYIQLWKIKNISSTIKVHITVLEETPKPDYLCISTVVVYLVSTLFFTTRINVPEMATWWLKGTKREGKISHRGCVFRACPSVLYATLILLRCLAQMKLRRLVLQQIFPTALMPTLDHCLIRLVPLAEGLVHDMYASERYNFRHTPWLVISCLWNRLIQRLHKLNILTINAPVSYAPQKSTAWYFPTWHQTHCIPYSVGWNHIKIVMLSNAHELYPQHVSLTRNNMYNASAFPCKLFLFALYRVEIWNKFPHNCSHYWLGLVLTTTANVVFNLIGNIFSNKRHCF